MGWDDALFFHLPHFGAQATDIPLFPLSCPQRVILKQQFLQLVRCIEVGLLGLQNRDVRPRHTPVSWVRTSGMNGAVCSLVSRVSQSIVENHGWLLSSSKPSPLGLHANLLVGSRSKNYNTHCQPVLNIGQNAGRAIGSSPTPRRRLVLGGKNAPLSTPGCLPYYTCSQHPLGSAKNPSRCCA